MGGRLPEGWAWTTLGEITRSMRNGVYKPASSYSPDGTITLRMYNIQGGELVLRDLKRVLLSDQELEDFGLLPGDILVNRVNSSELVGKSCVVPRGLGPLAFESKNIRVRLAEAMSSRYVGAWLQTPQVGTEFSQQCKQTTGMATLDQGQLALLDVPLPPAREQRRIVARLEELTARTNAARAALEAIPPLLDRFRQSVLAAAFRGDLTADWRAKTPDVEPASELLKRIRVERRRRWEEAELEKMRAKGKVPGDDRWKARYVEPEGVDAEGLPELPEGWAWATVEQAAFVNLGRQRSPKNHNGQHMRPYLRAANVTWSGIDISDVREMNFDPTEVTGYLLEPGDILLSEGSGSASEVGKPAVFRGEVSGCCFQNTLVRVRCPVLALVEWLHLHFLGDALSGRFASLSRGIGIHHIGREGVAQWPVAIPPLEEQRRILASVGQALESMEVTVGNVNAISTALTTLHQSLLSKAFRGELVPQDPTDEPASVLLERIRKEREAAGGGGRPKRGRKAK